MRLFSLLEISLESFSFQLNVNRRKHVNLIKILQSTGPSVCEFEGGWNISPVLSSSFYLIPCVSQPRGSQTLLLSAASFSFCSEGSFIGNGIDPLAILKTNVDRTIFRHNL